MRYVACLVMVALVLSVAAVPATAQQGQQGGPGGPGPGMGKGMQKEVTPEQFPEFKAQALKNIDERMKRMAEHRACIEKAQNHEEMRKCRPEPPMGSGPMYRGGDGPAPQRPPQTGGAAPK